MSTHTTSHLDRKVLLALVPLASLAASHEGNPNAHGPVNFSEIAESITAGAATISTSGTQPASAIETSSSSSSSHSTHLTPSLLHGIIPSVTTTATTTSPTSSSEADQTRTQTVWATVAQVTEIITVIKTLPLTPDHETSATDTSSLSTSQSWPKGYCTKKGEVALNGKCVPSTLVTSTTSTRGTKSSSSSGETSSSLSFTISSTSSSLTASPTSSSTPITTLTTSKPTPTSTSTSTSTSTDTDPLVIIPVTGTVTDLINYDTYTAPASLPPLPPLLPPPGPRGSASSKSLSWTSDDGPLEIIPVTGTVTDLADYETVMVPSVTATTVVVIPVSSGSGSGSSGSTTKSQQDVGQMLGHIQGMSIGGQSNSRVVVMHPTVSVGDRLTVVVSGSDGRTSITRASMMASASSSSETKGEGSGGEFCKEE